MDTEIISVIVPVYNCASYLDQCFDSIRVQTYSHLQIIAVDDGSTDESGVMLDNYAQNDSRITVIHRENGGVSAARNTGIEMSDGEWILFVDADDWLDKTYCERMLGAARQTDSDILIARSDVNDETKIKRYRSDEIEKLVAACLSYKEEAFAYNIDAPWGKLFRTAFVKENNIAFPIALSRSEDAYFCADAYFHTNKIATLYWFGYIHREREGSLCRSYAPHCCRQLEQILEENSAWVNKYAPDNLLFHNSVSYRVLPGIDECEHAYFLHSDNHDPVWKRSQEYQRFLNRPIIKKMITDLQISDIKKKQYKVRLIVYKLNVGFVFIGLKMVIGL